MTKCRTCRLFRAMGCVFGRSEREQCYLFDEREDIKAVKETLQEKQVGGKDV